MLKIAALWIVGLAASLLLASAIDSSYRYHLKGGIYLNEKHIEINTRKNQSLIKGHEAYTKPFVVIDHDGKREIRTIPESEINRRYTLD
jgi:hypothetical protein